MLRTLTSISVLSIFSFLISSCGVPICLGPIPINGCTFGNAPTNTANNANGTTTNGYIVNFSIGATNNSVLVGKSAQITVSGGSGNYTYTPNPGYTISGSTITGVTAGNYMITATDSAGNVSQPVPFLVYAANQTNNTQKINFGH